VKPAAAFLAAVLAAAPLPSLGQATPAPAVPSHSCAKPEFPGRVAPQPKLRRWQADFKTYMDCLKTYLNERNAAIDAQAAKAKATVDEINAGVAEYNEAIKGFDN
jgi:hypothetical protein